MRQSDVFPSKYLKAEDIAEGGLVVTISEVTVESFKKHDGSDEQKPVVHFDGGVKSLICNRTNWATIAEQLGEESDGWAGQRVKLIVLPVSAFGETVAAIRVAPRRKVQTTAAKLTATLAATPPPPPEVPESAWLEEPAY